jgi:hypothetical protein
MIHDNSVWQVYNQGCRAELPQFDSGLDHKYFSLTFLRKGPWEHLSSSAMGIDGCLLGGNATKETVFTIQIMPNIQ